MRKGPRTEESRQKQSAAWEQKRQAKIGNGTFLCLKCNQPKSVDEFPTTRRRKDGSPRYAWCRVCHTKYEHERKQRYSFNLTPEDEQKILVYQDERCGICGRPAQKVPLATDHRHSDGLIRGKLCWICNRLLGFVHDDVKRLLAAAAYLTAPPAIAALGEQRFGLPGRAGSKKQRKLAKKLYSKVTTHETPAPVSPSSNATRPDASGSSAS